MSGLDRDVWMAALVEAGIRTNDVDDQHAKTIDEFAEMFNLPHTTARNRLDALVSLGKATITRKTVTRSDGRRCNCKAYRLS